MLRTFLACSLFTLAALTASAQPKAEAVTSKGGVVACVSPPAADAGLNALKSGGNAVDAAVATAFAMAVTWPEAGIIGGGGFMMVAAPGKEPTCIEYRETAPAAAKVDLLASGDIKVYDHKVAGVPGTVRGLELAHKKYGKLEWKAVVMPAVELAEKGFAVNAPLASGLNKVLADKQTTNAEFKRVYGKPDGKPWKAGDTLVLKDLGRTLRLIAEKGADAFYTGEPADLLAKEMKDGGGLVTKADLEGYKANERKPIHTTFRGFDVFGPPPPSSGGIALAEMLNILETFDLKKHERHSPETMHLMIEAMKRAYADRAKHLGDPDFTKIPAELTTKDYAKKLAATIDPKKATPSTEIAPELLLKKESDSTTHFSVIDKDGLCVSNTYTLENSYGNRVVVRGAGYILNNEMTDFNWRTVTNTEGAIGTKPNEIAPGKRMLSSMTPVIVLKDGKPVLVTGSPGGRTIINTVLCVVLNVTEYGMSVEDAVSAPRLHHQWFPDTARFEDVKQPPSELVKSLRALGHRVGPHGQGDAHSIGIDPKTGLRTGAADKRRDGKAVGE